MQNKTLKNQILNVLIILISLSVTIDAADLGKVLIKYKKAPAGLRLRIQPLNLDWAIKTKESIQIKSYAKQNTNLRFRGNVSSEEVIVLSLKEGVSTDAVVQTLMKNNQIDYVEPLYPVELYSTDSLNDPYYSKQYYLSDTEISTLWDLSPQSHEILVAVVDTGVDVYHRDLNHAILKNPLDPVNGIDDDGNGYIDDEYGYNFSGVESGLDSGDISDGHGHGTQMAGIIAAKRNNKRGVAGMADSVSILPIKFLDETGRGDQLQAALAIRYAVDMGATIINCSWGYVLHNTVLEEAITYALDHGVYIVAAMGNHNSDINVYPAAFTGVYAIGSVSAQGDKSFFSNFGSNLDFVTYGEDIYSTTLDGRYSSTSGTSQSAALFTGIIANILSYDNSRSKEDFYSLLQSFSSYADSKRVLLGYGLIDISALVAELTISNDLNPIDHPLISDTKYLNDSEVEAEDEAEMTEEIAEIFEVDALVISDVMNFPNPIVESSTTFGFDSNQGSGSIIIDIYHLRGHFLERIEADLSVGYNKIVWSPNDYENGTYLYILIVDDGVNVRRKKGTLSILQ